MRQAGRLEVKIWKYKNTGIFYQVFIPNEPGEKYECQSQHVWFDIWALKKWLENINDKDICFK